MALPAVLFALSLVSSEKARSDQKEAARIERRRESIRNKRDKLQAIAQSNVTRAEQLSIAANFGGEGDSASQVAMGSARTQTFSNIGFSNFLENSKNRQLAKLDDAAQWGATARFLQLTSSVASFAQGGSGNALQDFGEMLGGP